MITRKSSGCRFKTDVLFQEDSCPVKLQRIKSCAVLISNGLNDGSWHGRCKYRFLFNKEGDVQYDCSNGQANIQPFCLIEFFELKNLKQKQCC